MNRQIKFRGKCIDTNNRSYEYGDWVKGYYVRESDDHYIISHDRDEIGFEATGVDINKVHVAPKTIGQYTGLKDSEGQEIYEGDVVKDKQGRKNLVVWDKELLGVGLKVLYEDREPFLEKGTVVSLTTNRRDDFKVIGNKFKNPKLVADNNG